MNKSVHEFMSLRVPATVAFMVSAGLAASPITWTVPETSRFNSPASNQSYSSFRQSLILAEQVDQAKFEKRISEIYSTLASQQVSQDTEIATLWDANIEDLYES
jgi:hypothetical protein